jgi:hypothetical protein
MYQLAFSIFKFLFQTCKMSVEVGSNFGFWIADFGFA